MQATSNPRGLRDRRAGARPAVATALALHAACLGALVGLSFLRPTPPPQETVVELAIVPAPEPPALPEPPAPPEPAPSPPAALPVAEPVAPPPPEPDPAPVETPAPPPVEAPPPKPAAIATPPLEAPPRPPLQPVHTPPPQHAATLPRPTPPRQEAAASAAPASSATAMPPAPAAGSANQEATLEARIRDAVQAAVHYPASARMMGITGRARLLLDYRSGNVAGPMLAQSSGTPTLDEAALAAARSARYPPAPPEIEGRLLRLLVWVEFRPG